jgi:hypothetical protein
MAATTNARLIPVDLWLAGAYLVLVGLAGVYVAYRLLFAPANSEFAGMPLLILALPWSDWLVPVARTSALAGWLGLLAGVFVNAFALVLLGRGLQRLVGESESGHG